MAKWHLAELENHIQQTGWEIAERLKGDHYQMTETWVIKRKSLKHIDFDCFNDMGFL